MLLDLTSKNNEGCSSFLEILNKRDDKLNIPNYLVISERYAVSFRTPKQIVRLLKLKVSYDAKKNLYSTYYQAKSTFLENHSEGNKYKICLHYLSILETKYSTENYIKDWYRYIMTFKGYISTSFRATDTRYSDLKELFYSEKTIVDYYSINFLEELYKRRALII